MIASINQLASLCANGSYLTPELIKQIDELTHSYGSKFQCDKASMCNEVWKIIQNSQMFWENTSLMLTQTQYDQTKFQALVLIHHRIKNNWYFQDQSIRNNAKLYLCAQTQNYNNGQMTKTRKSYFRKVNQIIVQILKYQWMGDWQNFLVQICQSIEVNPGFAQNYFDLLQVIFCEIFAEKEKLTSEEVRKINEEIVMNYGKIQKAFQVYLVPECPPNILKNAMIALESLIQWIPAYHVYFGLLIDKLVYLLSNQQNQIETLHCLLAIVALPNDQILEQLPTKAYEKRRQILLGILMKDRLKKNEEASTKTLTTALKFLQQMQSHIIQHGKQMILPDKKSQQEHLKITHKIQEWANESTAAKDQEFVIVLYKQIISAIKNQQDIEYLAGNVIEIAPCPYKTNFYEEQSIFKGFYGSEEQLELDRTNYMQLMKNLISNQEQQYFTHLTRCFEDDFTKSKKKIRHLWKLIWNFYYFVTVAQDQEQLKSKIFSVVNSLIFHENKILSIKKEKKDISSQDLLCLSSLKLGGFLILCNKRCRNQNLLIGPFVTRILRGFSQNNKFIKGMIDIMSISFDKIPFEAKEEIHHEYMKQMSNRMNRVQVDKVYIVMLAEWISKKKENFDAGYYMVQEILSFYKSSIITLTNTKINHRNAQQAESKQMSLLKQMRYLLRLSIAVLPYLKSQLVFEIHEFVQVIKQFVIISDLSGDGPDQTQFFQLTIKLFIANFAELSTDQINKNLQLLLKESSDIINFMFSELKKHTVNEDILQCIFSYLGSFILHFAKWEHNLEDKLNKISKIITEIYKYNYTYQAPGFTEFINKIVKCSLFPKLDNSLISQTLNKIFILASYQSEEKTLRAVEILKAVLSNSIDSIAGQSILSVYILDFISSTFTIMIKVKSKEEEYIKQFSDVLFMSLIFVKSMKFKFVENQINSNIVQVCNMMKNLTRKIFPHYNQYFLSKIDKMLQFMVSLTVKQEFKQKANDLVVILLRGY